MRVLVVLGHPKKGSFNHAIAETIVRTLKESSHEVAYHDLYEEGFDPILPGEEIAKDAGLDPVVRSHCEEVSEAEGIIVIHPNWWGQPPAVLKGWVDRVFRRGVAYEFAEGDSGEGVPIGLLRAKVALVFNTSDTPADRELAVFGDPLEVLWRKCIFGLCGVGDFRRKTYGVMVTSTLDQRKAWLKEAQETVGEHFPAGQEKPATACSI